MLFLFNPIDVTMMIDEGFPSTTTISLTCILVKPFRKIAYASSCPFFNFDAKNAYNLHL